MKHKYILVIIVFFIWKTSKANEHFNFINDCIQLYVELEKINDVYSKEIEENIQKEVLKKLIIQCNRELNSLSESYLLKYSESKIKAIQKSVKHYKVGISTLVKQNNAYLASLTNSEISQKKIIRKYNLLVRKSNLTLTYLSGISAHLCGVSVKDFKKMISTLTLKQRNLLNEQLIKGFGEDLKKGSKIKREEGSFANTAAFIYAYINLSDWNFQKE